MSDPNTPAVVTAEKMDRLMEFVEQEKDRWALAEQIMKDDPLLAPISALVIAGDRLARDRSMRQVEAGEMSAKDAMVFVGSYYRLDFALWAVEKNFLTADCLYGMLPNLWSGSDPNDMDPRFLDLWKRAKKWNKNRYLRDERYLPRNPSLVTLYRGQDKPDPPYGIAWSLSLRVAEKFARGAATRQAHRGGVVIKAQAWREDVLGYMTGRNEEEIVIDPAKLLPVIRA